MTSDTFLLSLKQSKEHNMEDKPRQSYLASTSYQTITLRRLFTFLTGHLLSRVARSVICSVTITLQLVVELKASGVFVFFDQNDQNTYNYLSLDPTIIRIS